jgi:hypothetical protein
MPYLFKNAVHIRSVKIAIEIHNDFIWGTFLRGKFAGRVLGSFGFAMLLFCDRPIIEYGDPHARLFGTRR